MKLKDILTEIDRRGFLKGLGAAAIAGGVGYGYHKSQQSIIDRRPEMFDLVARTNNGDLYATKKHFGTFVEPQMHAPGWYVPGHANGSFFVRLENPITLRGKECDTLLVNMEFQFSRDVDTAKATTTVACWNDVSGTGTQVLKNGRIDPESWEYHALRWLKQKYRM